MATKQLPHYPHHIREMHRTRRRFSAALAAMVVIFTVALGYQIQSASASVATTTNAYLDGVKIDTVAGGTYGGGTAGSFASATVTLKKLVNGVVSSTTTTSANPFYFYNLVPYTTTNKITYQLSISPTTNANYNYYGSVWCYTSNTANTCNNGTSSNAAFVASRTNFHAATVNPLTWSFAAYKDYHMRFMYSYVPTPTIITFSASPSSIAYGAKTTLSWQALNAANCTVSPGGTATTATSWTSGALTSSTTFTLTCKNSATGTISKTATVTVAGKPATPAPATPPPATPKPGTPTPPPGPPATPKPVTPTPKITPVPPAPGEPAPVPDTAPPSTPSDFQAMVSGSNAVVNLSWTASTDNQGIAGYTLERSTDQSSWNIVSDTITTPKFQDDQLSFNTKYFYRVKATDTSGNVSDYATADATTPEFSANSSGSDNVTYTSDDNIASAVVPGGTFDQEVACSVQAQDVEVNTGKSLMVAGPYALICQDATGNAITELKSPIAWTFTVKDQMKGKGKPTVGQVDGDGKSTVIKDAKYTAKTGIITFSSASFDSVFVMAAKSQPFPWNFIAIIFLVLLIVGAVVFVVLRQTQKKNYDDYLQKKYYNI